MLVAVRFSNENYDTFVAQRDANPDLAPVFGGILLFVGLSVALLALGVLRRLLFSSFRQRRGWGLVSGFFLGVSATFFVKDLLMFKI